MREDDLQEQLLSLALAPILVLPLLLHRSESLQRILSLASRRRLRQSLRIAFMRHLQVAGFPFLLNNIFDLSSATNYKAYEPLQTIQCAYHLWPSARRKSEQSQEHDTNPEVSCYTVGTAWLLLTLLVQAFPFTWTTGQT